MAKDISKLNKIMAIGERQEKPERLERTLKFFRNKLAITGFALGTFAGLVALSTGYENNRSYNQDSGHSSERIKADTSLEVYRASPLSGKSLPINLNQVLEREKTSEKDSLLSELVHISPINKNPETWQNFILYTSAIGNARDPRALTDENGKPNTWCIPCNALAAERTYEEIEEGLSKIPDTGLVKVFHPPSKIRPSIFEIEDYDAVPQIRIFSNQKGNLILRTQIEAPNTKAYARETLKTLAQIRNGKFQEVILSQDDFRKLKVYYEKTPDASADHLAIATAKALFPERISEDQQAVVLDLSDPKQFAFALETNFSKTFMQDRGRNIFQDIGRKVTKARVKAQDENVELRKKVKEIDEMLLVRNEYPDSPEYAARHAKAFKEFFEFSQQFVPSYIAPFYKNFVAQSQAEFLGEANEYIVLTDLTSRKVLQIFETWAEENSKKITKKSFLREENQNVRETLYRVRKALKILDERNIQYTVSSPKPVLERLTQSTPYAIVYVSIDPFIENIREIEEWQENPSLDRKSPLSLSTLLNLSEQLKDREDITYLVLPYVRTALGFTEAPNSSVTRFGDGFGGDPDTQALYVLRKGNYFYTPFDVPSAAKAAEKIVEKIKE